MKNNIILIITESPFFSSYREFDYKKEIKDLDKLINQLFNYSVKFEIEQFFDFISGDFPRTNFNKFDIVIIHSKSYKCNYWNNFDNYLNLKLSKNGKVYEFYNEKDNIKINRLISKLSSENKYQDYLFSSLKNSLLEDRLLRAELFVKILCLSEKLDLRKFFSTLHQYPKILLILERFLKILSDSNKLPNDFLVKNVHIAKENQYYFSIGLYLSDISLKNVEDILNSDKFIFDKFKDLLCKSNSIIASEYFFLSLKDKFSKNISNINLFIEKYCSKEVKILEKVCGLDPYRLSVWYMLTKLLWDNYKRVECGKVSLKGLKYFPNDSTLKIRYANGMHEEGDFEEAIKIYLELLEDDNKLIRINSIIFLSRCYFKINDFLKAEKYTNIALKYNPTNKELIRRIDLINKNK